MTDLAEKLDQSERQRLVAAIRALSDADYRDLMISLLGGIGVRVQSAKEQQGILIIYGQGEEGYLVLASRMEFSDPELIVRSLIEDAANMGRTPVFMALQQLDPRHAQPAGEGEDILCGHGQVPGPAAECTVWTSSCRPRRT